MKPEDTSFDTPEVTPKKKSGRKRKNLESSTESSSAKRTPKQRSSVAKNVPNDAEITEANKTPKRGRPRKSTGNVSVNGSSTRKRPTTKAGLAGSNERESYSYADLFPTEDEEIDENVDAGDDDSEYEPSDEEIARRINNSSRKKRTTRRTTRSQVSQPEVAGSTDEDEAGESDSEFEDEEDEDDLLLEQHELRQSANNDPSLTLFSDDNAKVQRDVYDFDAQSILSDRRGVKRRSTGASKTRQSGASVARTTQRARRNTTGMVPTWGSNIYSAIAASLRTRADLDAYSTFLKSTNIQNTKLDHLIAEICKPSNQHSNMFYGASASLQSIMSRINDNDKVVELLHAFVSRPFEQMRHRVVCLAPVIHQPVFGLNHSSSVTVALQTAFDSIDQNISVRPVYLLNQDTNLLAIPSISLNEFGITSSQYGLITGSGNMGRFMPDMKHFLVPSDLYAKLTDLIAIPAERTYEVALARAHRIADADVNTSPIEPPNLQRLMLVADSEGTPIAITILDYCNESDLPATRPNSFIELAAVNKDGSCRLPSIELTASEQRLSVEEEVQEILNELIDWTVLKTNSTETMVPKRPARLSKSALGQLRYMDAFLVKPNGRRDYLLLVTHQQICHPPLEKCSPDNNGFCTYCIFDEGHFLLERHGFIVDSPVSSDTAHTADPEELLEDQSLLVVPDLLYDTLRKVMLHEFVGVSTVTSSLFNPKMSESAILPSTVTQCTKFVIVDRMRRMPLAVVFDSPVRFSLQVSSEKACVHPFGEEASKQFDHLSPTELKALGSAFKPTSAEYRLVTIGGLLYGLQIDDQKVVRRILEITPARVDKIFPNALCPSVCAQSVIASSMSSKATVRILNDESNSSTVLPAFYFSTCERQRYGQVVTSFSEHLANLLYELPIKVSLYDVMFRLGQKHMPELLAQQHIESAEAAAYAEAAANPNAPPPAPVPMPEIWGVCCICSKELRSPNGLLDHEMRHIGLSRFRCVVHDTNFLDRRQWQQHMNEMHSTSRSLPLVAALPHVSSGTQADSGSDQEDAAEEDEPNGPQTAPGVGLLVGLTQVFSLGILVGRMEAPQCEKCGDYYLNADVLAHHMDFCDGVSFTVRTPIPRSQKSSERVHDNSTADTNDVDDSEIQGDACVCGMCGSHLASRDKILQHFSTHHLQCILCNNVLRSLEELSNHYQTHLKTDFNFNESTLQSSELADAGEDTKVNSELDTASEEINQKKVLLQKLMSCDICGNFYGTKYNFFFHQWSEHGVVHPTDGAVQSIQQSRAPRSLPEQDELCYLMAGVRRIKCKFCGHVVRVAGKEYVSHLKEEHGVLVNPDVVCRICAELFESPEELSLHLGETHAPSGEYANAGVQTIFHCTYCDFWAFAKGLPKHSRDVHGDPNPAMYECTHCYERFSDKRLWRTHLDKHNESYSQRCLECGRAFRLRSSLLHHIRQYHGEEDGPATCEYCGLTYPKRGALRFHIFRIHNDQLAYECSMCQRRFHMDSELQMHIKEMHSGAVQCEICNKVCANLRSFAQHRQKHFRTRIYQCTDCNATFKSKLAMKRHIRVEHLQLGPERFECQICGKIVTQIGMHMLIHKEARFECEYCGKRFTKAAYYNEHLRIHLGEQPFECHICQKKFNKKSNLNVHLRFHEKHRDEDGNYLELKPRGRVSTMFGDALMSPSDRAARQAAAARGQTNVPKVDAAVGSDLPGAFNASNGPAGAAEEAAERAIAEYGMDDEMIESSLTMSEPCDQ